MSQLRNLSHPGAELPSRSDGADDDHLLQTIMDGGTGSGRAIAALYDRYEVQMLRFFRAHSLDIHDAEDLLQYTFVKVIEKARSLKEVSNGRAWLWQIARNTLLDALRRRKSLSRRQELFDDDEVEGYADPSSQSVESGSPRRAEECVSAGLLAFKRDFPDRWFVVSEQLDGAEINSISIVIGRSIAATTVYISQSKKKLAPYIDNCRALLVK